MNLNITTDKHYFHTQTLQRKDYGISGQADKCVRYVAFERRRATGSPWDLDSLAPRAIRESRKCATRIGWPPDAQTVLIEK
ncbi:hypothetical protein ALC60_05819 [Trachymyrmex zeteki]|uniref:Uncharacterized protein n=1 Tax=Mycetomoellerius zeteki TaxID=64791 RepID=A0A151X4I0_9HYME|nr:hypothetical protein ALC60_05819 [Trachymyrmex zeteki]